MTWASRRWVTDILPLLLSVGVLAAGVFYAFVNVFVVPKPGLVLTTTWSVASIDICLGSTDESCAADADLQVDDQILQIGTVTYEAFRNDLDVTPFLGYGPNDLVTITRLRNGVSKDIEWRMPDVSTGYRWLSGSAFLVFLPFWLAGTVVLLVLRPRGRLWATLAASNYLMALWVITGSNSSSQAAGMGYVYILSSWLLVPVYLHLHLEALGKTGRQWRSLLIGLYAAGIVVAVLALLRVVPTRWSSLAVGGVVVASLILLAGHWRAPAPATRLVARLMTISVGLAFGPGLLFLALTAVTNARAASSLVTTVALLALAIWPIGYVYAAFRNYLGAVEFRANRLITQYSYAIIVGTIVGVVIVLQSNRSLTAWEALASVGLMTAAVMTFVALYRPFQRWMERQAYGVVHTPEDILRVMARQLPVVSDEPELIRLLADELLPSLLVRESALYRLAPGAADLVYQRGIVADLPPAQLANYLEHLWVFLSPQQQPGWVRLAVPLDVQQRRLGLWLFGRRDPDDYYSAQDIALLRLLANQIAVALENSRLYQTVQRQAEEMAQLYQAEKEVSRLKSEFLARTSHELRTPLTGILGSLGLVLDDLVETPEEQRKFVETAHKSASTLMRLVNDLLDMAQIEAGRLTTRLWPVDAHLLLAEVYAEFEAQARLKGLRFELVDASTEPALIWADPDRARQILRNLVDNALKFTATGFVRVSAQPDALAGLMQVFVEDSGIGVAADQQEALFQPFVQVDGGDKRRFGGSGLGLAISRRLAELMGGTVSLYSEGDGRGCTVTFTLRLATGENANGDDPDQPVPDLDLAL